jgi:hypothetical protein
MTTLARTTRTDRTIHPFRVDVPEVDFVGLRRRIATTRWPDRETVADSPVGMAAWMLDHDARSYELIARVFDGKPEGLTRDDVLDNVTLYWLTNTAVSSARCIGRARWPSSRRRAWPSRWRSASSPMRYSPMCRIPSSAISNLEFLIRGRRE